MAIAVRQIKVVARTTADSVGTAFTDFATVLAGSLLLAHAAVFNNGGTAAKVFSDGTNGTWVVSGTSGYAVAGDADSEIDLASFPNSGSAALTITCNPNGTTGCTIDLTTFEVTGAETGAPLDKSVTASGTYNQQVGTTAADVATGTLAQAAELIVSSFSHTGESVALTPDSGESFTQASENESNSTGQTFCLQYKIVAATTSVVVDGVVAAHANSGTPTWFAGVATYKEAAAAGGDELADGRRFIVSPARVA